MTRRMPLYSAVMEAHSPSPHFLLVFNYYTEKGLVRPLISKVRRCFRS